MNKRNYNTKAFAETALLFALLLVLAFLESLLPPPPLPLPVRWGFSNIVLLYAIFFKRFQTGLSLVLFKALFALLSRGLLAASLSFSGTLLAYLIMLLLHKPKRLNCSLPFISILGALGHQLGQLFVLRHFFPDFGLQNFLRLSLPLFGLAALSGTLTAIILGAALKNLEGLRSLSQGL